MKLLAAVLGLALAAVSARAATPEETVRAEATTLGFTADALAASSDAPQLSGQLTRLRDGLKALRRERPALDAGARSVEDAVSDLQQSIQRAAKPLGYAFCAKAAGKVRTISAHALGLLRDGSSAVAGRVPDFSPRFPPADAAALAAFQTRAARMAGVMGRTNFDGNASAPATILAPAAAPTPREAARAAKADAARRTTAYQGALRAYLKAARRPAITADGVPGPATARAVAYFQKKNGLKPTGAVDDATAKALLSDYQARRELSVTGELDAATAAALAQGDPPVYFAGSPSDFDASPKAATVKRVLATVYTPFKAQTPKQRRMEGPPIDAHDQTVCTLERYLGGDCPYVSVAIDSRLGVPNGTPLLIPEISALVGRAVQFRIVDTGSLRRFQGTGHVDIATDSNQHEGYGRSISGGSVTLVLPRGLHPRL